VAVTGFDDIPFADLFKQSLTTMHVPRFDLGVKAAEMLLERINGNTSVSEIVITPQLVVRESAP
jgi:DNA-binding LacI/PurR family transcriptional regulator